MGETMEIGKSVGVIMKNKQGEYLVLWRLKEPLGLALPAGHLEPGESPEECARRELFEETGLRVNSLRRVFFGNIPSPINHCGHESHEWTVYAAETDEEPELKEPKKHRFVKFMSLEEVRPYIRDLKYDSAWFMYILPALHII